MGTSFAVEFRPLLGFARAPGAKIPEATIPQADLEAFAHRERKPKPFDYLPSYCYWFVKRSGERQRELFFGNGGMTVLFMKPDPKTQPPAELAQLLPYVMGSKMLAPLRQKFDIEKMVMSPNPLAGDFRDRYIAESPEKMRRIVRRFKEHLGDFAPVAPQCNAPWVSAVVEVDGSVRPCFFHRRIGSVEGMSLEQVM